MTSTGARSWTDLSYLVVDVEGNGDRPPRLVEFAAVPITGGVIGEPVSWLVKPPTPITWQARKIHGIDNVDVAELPGVESIRDELVALLADHIIVGHNVHVDLDVLTRELPGWQPASHLDTLRLARRVLPELETYRLGGLVNHFDLAAGLPEDLRPHRATYDVLVTARLLAQLNNLGGAARTIDELRQSGALISAADHDELRLFE